MQLEDMNSWAEEEMGADTASREALQQAQAENLTLLVPNSKMGYSNKTGYTGVSFRPNRSKPYQAGARRGGKTISLGYFTTAEEAALCVARSPEVKAAAAVRAAAAVPLTSEEARQQAQAEGLTLRVSENKTGYSCVRFNTRCRSKPFDTRVWRGGNAVSLGYFATAEEAALCVARSPEGRAAAEKTAAAPPLTGEEVRQQAQAEGLTLRTAANKTGFFGVSTNHPGQPKPFQGKVGRKGNVMSLGTFATAEEAALYIARSPEGRAAAAARPLTSEEALQQTRLWDARTIRAVALDIIYEAAGAATAELSAEVAAEVMAGIAMGL